MKTIRLLLLLAVIWCPVMTSGQHVATDQQANSYQQATSEEKIFSPKRDTAYFDIRPYLFQKRTARAVLWDSTSSRMLIGLGVKLSLGKSLWSLQWNLNALHAVEGVSSFETPFRDFTLNYLFHFGAFARGSNRHHTHDIWGVAGYSQRGVGFALRYKLSHEHPIQLWVENGLSIPASSSAKARIRPYFSMGVHYNPYAFMLRGIHQKTAPELSRLAWSIGVTSSDQEWGSRWSFTWTPSLSGIFTSAIRISGDRYASASIFHTGLDFTAPVTPLHIPFQLNVGFSPEWYIAQSSASTQHRLGYSWMLTAIWTGPSGYAPFLSLRHQYLPARQNSIEMGIRLCGRTRENNPCIWFTDCAEWLMGIPNIGSQISLSDKINAEAMVSSAWFDFPKRTHRFQSLRVGIIFPSAKRWTLTPSLHFRWGQYDFRYRQKGEMGKGWEFGGALSRDLPAIKARIQMDIAYAVLERSPYHHQHYAVRSESARWVRYFGPTALRFIRYWGANPIK